MSVLEQGAVSSQRASRIGVERRVEPRFTCQGPVVIRLGEASGEIQGELINVSAHGFRLSLDQPAVAIGTVLAFRHRFYQGRAQVMWMRQIEGRIEAGCMVLRD